MIWVNLVSFIISLGSVIIVVYCLKKCNKQVLLAKEMLEKAKMYNDSSLESQVNIRKLPGLLAHEIYERYLYDHRFSMDLESGEHSVERELEELIRRKVSEIK